MIFRGWAPYPEVMTVEWSVDEAASKLVKLEADGNFCLFEPTKVTETNKRIVVTARSSWKRTPTQTVPVELKSPTEKEATEAAKTRADCKPSSAPVGGVPAAPVAPVAGRIAALLFLPGLPHQILD